MQERAKSGINGWWKDVEEILMYTFRPKLTEAELKEEHLVNAFGNKLKYVKFCNRQAIDIPYS